MHIFISTIDEAAAAAAAVFIDPAEHSKPKPAYKNPPQLQHGPYGGGFDRFGKKF